VEPERPERTEGQRRRSDHYADHDDDRSRLSGSVGPPHSEAVAEHATTTTTTVFRLGPSEPGAVDHAAGLVRAIPGVYGVETSEGGTTLSVRHDQEVVTDALLLSAIAERARVVDVHPA
jgi:hypothetical protein